MKIILSIILLLVLGLSCNKQKDKDYYFTCKVNGVVWETECKDNGYWASKCFTARFNQEFTSFDVDATRKGEQIGAGIIDTIGKISSGTYALNDEYINGIYATGIYSKNLVSHRTDSIHIGILNINIDEANTIIFGTFSFNTATGYSITEGKFRMPYTLDK